VAIRLGALLPTPSSGLLRNPAREPRDELTLNEFPHDLSPGGVCLAEFVSKFAVRSYRPVSPLLFAKKAKSGLFSVALSFKLP
jgi:hypothetical protein